MFYNWLKSIGISKDQYNQMDIDSQIKCYKDYRLSKLIEELNDIHKGVNYEF